MVMTVLGLEVGRPVGRRTSCRILPGSSPVPGCQKRGPDAVPACATSPRPARCPEAAAAVPPRSSPARTGSGTRAPRRRGRRPTVGRRRHPQALQVGHAQFDQPAEPVVVGLHLRHREAAPVRGRGHKHRRRPLVFQLDGHGPLRHPARLHSKVPTDHAWRLPEYQPGWVYRRAVPGRGPGRPTTGRQPLKWRSCPPGAARNGHPRWRRGRTPTAPPRGNSASP